MNTKNLDDKKVIFIGNSFIYYGGCVDVTDNAPLGDDFGYFYSVCRANGENTKVTDATYGGHHLYDYITNCTCTGTNCPGIGTDLLEGLDLSQYDYVVMAESGDYFGDDAEHGSTVYNFNRVKKRFLDAGCRATFVYCLHTYPYTKTNQYYEKAIAQAQTLADEGNLVVNWGEPVWNIIQRGSVDGGKMTYNKDSFIVNKSPRDGFHPNLLTGFISALSVYCTITQKSAVGQKWDFCSATRDIPDYIGKYYLDGATTNFDKIFASDADMLAIEREIDLTVAKWRK